MNVSSVSAIRVKRAPFKASAVQQGIAPFRFQGHPEGESSTPTVEQPARRSKKGLLGAALLGLLATIMPGQPKQAQAGPCPAVVSGSATSPTVDVTALDCTNYPVDPDTPVTVDLSKTNYPLPTALAVNYFLDARGPSPLLANLTDNRTRTAVVQLEDPRVVNEPDLITQSALLTTITAFDVNSFGPGDKVIRGTPGVAIPFNQLPILNCSNPTATTVTINPTDSTEAHVVVKPTLCTGNPSPGNKAVTVAILLNQARIPLPLGVDRMHFTVNADTLGNTLYVIAMHPDTRTLYVRHPNKTKGTKDRTFIEPNLPKMLPAPSFGVTVAGFWDGDVVERYAPPEFANQ